MKNAITLSILSFATSIPAMAAYECKLEITESVPVVTVEVKQGEDERPTPENTIRQKVHNPELFNGDFEGLKARGSGDAESMTYLYSQEKKTSLRIDVSDKCDPGMLPEMGCFLLLKDAASGREDGTYMGRVESQIGATAIVPSFSVRKEEDGLNISGVLMRAEMGEQELNSHFGFKVALGQEKINFNAGSRYSNEDFWSPKDNGIFSSLDCKLSK